MGRIAEAFKRSRTERRAAIAPYFTVGYPDLPATIEGVRAAIQAGADMIELGVPFSDPLADGATIQKSSTTALVNGVTLHTCLDAARDIRALFPDTPILLMGYYNPFLQYGLGKTAEHAAAAGIDGLIVPDLPPEESPILDDALKPHGIDLIYMVAPTSPPGRIAAIAQRARGFIYCVSLTGVTGARAALSASVPTLIQDVRAHAAVPLMLGFGISQPDHVASVASQVDGVVIGSAMVNLMGETSDAERARAVGNYVRGMADAGRYRDSDLAHSIGRSQ